jgi:hypothetical protein
MELRVLKLTTFINILLAGSERNESAGTRIAWPIRRYKTPTLEVMVPKKNRKPRISRGRV